MITQHCIRHERDLPSNRFLSPRDNLCVLCKIEIREDERPISNLLSVPFRTPKPLKKRGMQDRLKAVHSGP